MKIFMEMSRNAVTHDGNTFMVDLISAGPGSSGVYPAAVLESDIATALPKGTKVYFDHTDEWEAMSGRARSMENLVGVFEEDPVYDPVNEKSRVPVRFYENSPKFNNVPAFIKEAMGDIGVSIEIYEGEISDKGIVESLGYSPRNSLAVVTAAGARGRIAELVESFRATEETKKTGGSGMDEEAVKAIVAEHTAPILEAIQALQPKKEEAPALAVVAEAVASAGLTQFGRQAVYAQVQAGVAVEAAVKSEKEREEAIKESLKSDPEFIVQESKKDDYAAKAEALFGGGK